MPYGRRATQAEAGRGPAEIDFNALWDRGYVPTIKALGYEPVRADQDTGGLIVSQMLERLYFADLVLADMTIPNGNVYYEVGIRHAAKRDRLRPACRRLVQAVVRCRADADHSISASGRQHNRRQPPARSISRSRTRSPCAAMGFRRCINRSRATRPTSIRGRRRPCEISWPSSPHFRRRCVLSAPHRASNACRKRNS